MAMLLLATALVATAVQSTPVPAPPAEWAGWLGLTALVAAFGWLGWWLLASPLPRPIAPSAATTRLLRVRGLLAGVVLLSGVLVRVGAPWDELWHRLYGVPFGQDLLWPPHLLLYASFTLSFLLVWYGLSVGLDGPGSLQARFRREPLLAALGLLSVYAFAFIPVDVVWHQVIGPDLMAESPPHLVGALSGAAVSLCGVALALSTLPRPGWRSLLDRPRAADVVALGILAVLALNWLQLLTTGWEWGDPVVRDRPGWTYAISVLVVGGFVSHVALHATRRVGAATAVALVALAAHLPVVALYRLLLPPGPAIAAHLLLVPPALVLDAWYVRRGQYPDTARARWTGALLHATVLLAVGLPYMAVAFPAANLGGTSVLASVGVGVPAGLATSLIGARLGRWSGGAGRAQTSRAAIAAERLEAGASPQASSAPADASRVGGARW